MSMPFFIHKIIMAVRDVFERNTLKILFKLFCTQKIILKVSGSGLGDHRRQAGPELLSGLGDPGIQVRGIKHCRTFGWTSRVLGTRQMFCDN